LRTDHSFFLYGLESEKALLGPVVEEHGGELRTVPSENGEPADRAVSMRPGQYCLGAICSGEASRGVLKETLTKFDQHFDGETGIWTAADEETPLSFEAWLKDRALELVAENFTILGQSELALARLRVEYQGLLERFEKLVRRHNAVLAPTRIMAANIIARAASFRVPSSADGMMQLLPCQPQGLAEVEVCVLQPPAEGAEGECVLRLQVRYTDIQHEVAIPAGEIHAGWTGFRFPRALTEDDAEAEIHLFWTGDADQAPVLALGSANPLPEARLSLNEVTLSSPMAMRVWKAEPGSLTRAGMTVDKLDELAASEKGEDRDLRGDLSWGQLTSLRCVGSAPAGAPDTIVTIKESEGFVIVHPGDIGVTTAVVDGLEAGRINRITGLFHLARPECDAVEVAVGVAPMATPDDELLPYLGPWQTIEPLQWAEASVVPGIPADGLKRIIVATRMVDGKSSAWAWAAVARITIS